MTKDRADVFLVVRVSATIIVHCEHEPNVPTFYRYNDAVRKMQSLRQQFHNSTWAVVPIFDWMGND
jgi:hypothetical protein